MGGNIPPEVFQEYLEHQRAAEARQQRMTTRRILAEMVRQEVEARRLTGRRQKALVRFACRYGIDEYEARLLIRAASLGVGVEASAEQGQIAREYLAELDQPGDHRWSLWMWATVLAANCLCFYWLARR